MPSRRELIIGSTAAIAGLYVTGIARAKRAVPSEARLLVKGAIRRDETILRFDVSGDNFHMSWSADDRQFVSVCDGYGLRDNSSFNSRALAISGDPAGAIFRDLPDYPRLEPGDGMPRYYAYGTLAIDGHIYQFLSALSNGGEKADGLPPNRFVGVKAIYSPDNGETWCNQDGTTPVIWEGWEARNRKSLLFFQESQESFSWFTVLQMGRNYGLNTDGYVYIYAPNGNTEGTMNELVMLRVPKGRILERSAYEFFVRRNADGSAAWSKDIDTRGVVYTFPSGWVHNSDWAYSWGPSVVYNSALRVYMMSNWGSGAGRWAETPSYLGLWIASQPWGPWTQIHEEKEWYPGNNKTARAYQPQISPKWISEDGKSFWLVWSDFCRSYDDAEFNRSSELVKKIVDERERNKVEHDMFVRFLPRYQFNLQRVDLTF